jgi:hypothetical protein
MTVVQWLSLGALATYGVVSWHWYLGKKKAALLGALVRAEREGRGELSGRELSEAGGRGFTYGLLLELEQEGLIVRRIDGLVNPQRGFPRHYFRLARYDPMSVAPGELAN